MRRLKRPIAGALGALLLLLLLAACGSASTKDVPVSQITEAVSAAIGKTDDLIDLDATFLGYTRLNPEDLGDYAVLVNAYGANIDEYGVFKAGTKTAAELKTVVDGYLESRKAAWMEAYMPEEKPKMMAAEARVSGDYVIYCILSDSDKTAAFQAFENAIR